MMSCTGSLAVRLIGLAIATSVLVPPLPLAGGEPRQPPIRFILQWGKPGKAAGEFHSPIGIAINAHDEIFVTEFRNNRVQKFSAQGKFLAQFPVGNMPGGVAVDSQGHVYVALLLEHKICVYDPAGRLIRTWGKRGKGDGEFDQPGGIAIARDGTVYVADQVNRRVQRFTPEGKFLGKWGEYGSKPGQFDGVEHPKSRTGGPNFLALDRHGNVYTTEAKLGRIQKFTADGKPLLAFGKNNTEPGGFGGRPKNLPGPIAIAVDRWDRIWVSATNNRVQCFSSAGKYLFGFESLTPGTKPGQFHTPHGLAFDGQNHLYVVDAQNQRVQKFAIPPGENQGQRTQLTQGQKDAIAKLRAKAKLRAAPLALRLALLARQANENMLAEQPNQELSARLGKQIRELLSELLSVRLQAIKDSIQVLTPAQRRDLHAKLRKPGSPLDLMELMEKTYKLPGE